MRTVANVSTGSKDIVSHLATTSRRSARSFAKAGTGMIAKLGMECGSTLTLDHLLKFIEHTSGFDDSS